LILIFLVVTVLTISGVSAVAAANDTSTNSIQTVNATTTQISTDQSSNQTNSANSSNQIQSTSNVNTISNGDKNQSSSVTTGTNSQSNTSSVNDVVNDDLSSLNVSEDVNNVSTISKSNAESTNTVDDKNIVSNNTGIIQAANINNSLVSTNTTTLKTAIKTDSMQSVNINVTPVTVNTGSTITLTAKINYANGTPVNNQVVVFKITGVTINKTIVTNGIATINYTVPNWSANTYNMAVIIGQTGTSYAATGTSTFTVLRTNTTMEIDRLFFGVSGNRTLLTAVIKDTAGNTVTYGKVCFKLNGKTLGTVKITGGVASIYCDLSSVKEGVYNITAIYGANSYYNSVTSNVNLRVQSSMISFTKDQVLKASNSLKSYIESNNVLPNYVTVGTVKVSMTNFLYLMCQSLYSNTSLVAGNFANGTLSYGTNVNNSYIYKSAYMGLASSILKCYAVNGRTPTVFTVSGVSMSYADTIYFFSRITCIYL